MPGFVAVSSRLDDMLKKKIRKTEDLSNYVPCYALAQVIWTAPFSSQSEHRQLRQDSVQQWGQQTLCWFSFLLLCEKTLICLPRTGLHFQQSYYTQANHWELQIKHYEINIGSLDFVENRGFIGP